MMIKGIAGQIRVGAHFHLFEDAGTVGADRFLADAEFVRDTFQRFPPGDQAQNLKFAV